MRAQRRFVDIWTPTPRWNWNWKSWSDLFCLLISILIDAIKFRIERTATVKVGVFLFSGLIFWCWTISLWTHCRCSQCRVQNMVQVASNIHLALRLFKSLEKCNLQTIEKFETHEGCDCIRQDSEGFIKNSTYLIVWNVSSVGKWSENSANSLLAAPPNPREAFRAFHNKNTDDRSLIWRTEPDKRGLPLDGFAIDRHFTFYFAE